MNVNIFYKRITQGMASVTRYEKNGNIIAM